MAITNMDPFVAQREYLRLRGFDTSDSNIEKAGIEFAGATKTYQLLNKQKPAADNREAVIFHYPGSDYLQVRWMEEGYNGGWGTQITKKADCPKGRPSECYLPALCNWTTYTDTPRVLYLCESALKALILAQAGYYAIGGAGVWGLFNKNDFVPNFPHALLEEGPDVTTRVEVLFDSDYRRNPHVRGAIRSLGNAIKERYPAIDVQHRQLPDPPVGTEWWDSETGSGKWGVDDAIMHHGTDWLRDFLESDKYTAPIDPSELQRHMDELSTQYATVAYPPGIVRFKNGKVYTRSEFKDILESRRQVIEYVNDKPKQVAAAECWLKAEEHTHVEELTYKPGSPQLQEGDYFNQWQDTGVRPVEGDIEPFLKVYRNAVPDPEERRLLLESSAWIMQNRGTRMAKTFMLIGSQVGTGKSRYAQIMGRLVGKTNYSSIGVEDFGSDYNSAFVGKEIVLLDDLYQLNRAKMGKLRRYVTDETILCNPKRVQQYDVDNLAVWYMTANEWTAMDMGDNERRVVVVHFNPKTHYETGTPWWKEFYHWLDHENGYGIIRWWMEQLDIGDFDPNFMPPMTEAKKHMVQSSASPEQEWINDLYAEPSSVLPESHLVRSVFTAEELYTHYSGRPYEETTRGEKTAWGRALASKFFRANGGRKVRINGKLGRYWIIQNRDGNWYNEAIRKDISQKTGKF